MNLEKLLEGIEYRVLQGSTNKMIRNLVMDSRKAKEGDLFIYIRGAISDGHRFVKEVLKEKVSAVLVESMDKEIKKDFPKVVCQHKFRQ